MESTPLFLALSVGIGGAVFVGWVLLWLMNVYIKGRVGSVPEPNRESAPSQRTAWEEGRSQPRNLLLERLIESGTARIVNVASDAHRLRGVRMRFDALEGAREYRPMRAYGQSKLANILFTRAWARRLSATAVTANCLHPGMVATRLGANNGLFARIVLLLLRPFSLSPEQGSETSVYLCSSPDVEGETGKYYAGRKETRPSQAGCRDADADRLWEISERMTGANREA